MTQNKLRRRKTMNNEKRNLILMLIVGVGIGVLGGFVLGMFYQQLMFIAGAVEFAEGLEGTNIEINVDLNETQIVEGFTKFINESLIDKEFKNDSR